MQLEAKKYLLNAKVIIDNNSAPFFLVATIGVLFYVSDLSFYLAFILALFVYPLAYGQYVEIILHNRQASYFQIFQTHWSN